MAGHDVILTRETTTGFDEIAAAFALSSLLKLQPNQAKAVAAGGKRRRVARRISPARRRNSPRRSEHWGSRSRSLLQSRLPAPRASPWRTRRTSGRRTRKTAPPMNPSHSRRSRRGPRNLPPTTSKRARCPGHPRHVRSGQWRRALADGRIRDAEGQSLG